MLDETIRQVVLLRMWTEFDALFHHLLDQCPTVTEQAAKEALERLRSLELIERDASGRVRLSEPDRPETSLYAALFDKLSEAAFLTELGVGDHGHVLVNTSQGGPTDGRFTRPDFTLATVRTWLFDPQRTLEVFSFEVKNRAGSTVPAVYEAVAHGRFVHRPYLVIPNSRLAETNLSAIKDACEIEGVGLIFFELDGAVDSKSVLIRGVRHIVEARRRNPDPAVVQQFLLNRFANDKKSIEKLQFIAQGREP